MTMLTTIQSASTPTLRRRALLVVARLNGGGPNSDRIVERGPVDVLDVRRAAPACHERAGGSSTVLIWGSLGDISRKLTDGRLIPSRERNILRYAG